MMGNNMRDRTSKVATKMAVLPKSQFTYHPSYITHKVRINVAQIIEYIKVSQMAFSFCGLFEACIRVCFSFITHNPLDYRTGLQRFYYLKDATMWHTGSFYIRNISRKYILYLCFTYFLHIVFLQSITNVFQMSNNPIYRTIIFLKLFYFIFLSFINHCNTIIIAFNIIVIIIIIKNNNKIYMGQ